MCSISTQAQAQMVNWEVATRISQEACCTAAPNRGTVSQDNGRDTATKMSPASSDCHPYPILPAISCESHTYKHTDLELLIHIRQMRPTTLTIQESATWVDPKTNNKNKASTSPLTSILKPSVVGTQRPSPTGQPLPGSGHWKK